jgi:hypothetical protein
MAIRLVTQSRQRNILFRSFSSLYPSSICLARDAVIPSLRETFFSVCIRVHPWLNTLFRLPGISQHQINQRKSFPVNRTAQKANPRSTVRATTISDYVLMSFSDKSKGPELGISGPALRGWRWEGTHRQGCCLC